MNARRPSGWSPRAVKPMPCCAARPCRGAAARLGECDCPARVPTGAIARAAYVTPAPAPQAVSFTAAWGSNPDGVCPTGPHAAAGQFTALGGRSTPGWTASGSLAFAERDALGPGPNGRPHGDLDGRPLRSALRPPNLPRPAQPDIAGVATGPKGANLESFGSGSGSPGVSPPVKHGGSRRGRSPCCEPRSAACALLSG